MGNKCLLLFLEIDEDVLPAGNSYTELPDKLDRAISDIQPGGVELRTVYLLGPTQSKILKKLANDSAIDYHHHAVTVRGEKCEEEECEQHPVQNVLSFYDHQKRNHTPPGVN